VAWWRTIHHADRAHDRYEECEEIAVGLRAERDRITVAERDTDALRRELRKLSGKFYAAQREAEEPPDDELQAARGHADAMLEQSGRDPGGPGVCENWTMAQTHGPTFDFNGVRCSACDCAYCSARRAHREAQRRALVPKGAQATAQTARVNAAKPR
jgi:hypothetical protein